MKSIQHGIAVAAIAVGLAAPASAGQMDPEILIYRFPGVRDDGGDTNIGVATAFHCTNFSGQLENIRLVTRDSIGALRSNNVIPVGHLITVSRGCAARHQVQPDSGESGIDPSATGGGAAAPLASAPYRAHARRE